MSNDESHLNNQRLLNIGLLDNAKALVEQNSNLRQQINELRQQPSSPNSFQTRQQRENLEDLEIENISLQNDNTALQNNYIILEKNNVILKNNLVFYKNLLAKPMHEIADSNESFRNTYELQQQLLADWMVSQRAFKELAIDLGLQLGKTKEDILEQGVANKEKVLNNQTDHKNNVEDLMIDGKSAIKILKK